MTTYDESADAYLARIEELYREDEVNNAALRRHEITPEEWSRRVKATHEKRSAVIEWGNALLASKGSA